MTLSATEAPMPTLPDFASESAFAWSSSLLAAFSVTLPVPALTVAPEPMVASVSFVMMLSPRAPAIETVVLSPPAPDWPSAMNVFSLRR